MSFAVLGTRQRPASAQADAPAVVFRAAVVGLLLAPDGLVVFALLRVAPEVAWRLYWLLPVVPLVLGVVALAAAWWPRRARPELVAAAVAATLMGVGIRVALVLLGR